MVQVSVGGQRSAARPHVHLSHEPGYKYVSFQVCYVLEIKRSISEKDETVLKAIILNLFAGTDVLHLLHKYSVEEGDDS
jgi:hypothetical protein